MTIEEVNQEVTYGPKTGPSGRSDISAVRQVGGLAVARWRSMRWRSTMWKPMRRLMRTGQFEDTGRPTNAKVQPTNANTLR